MSAHTESRFPAEVYGKRLERAAELTRAAHLDALLVTPGPDLRYLIGSRAQSFERLTCLVIPASGQTPSVVIPKLELASLAGSAAGELGLQILDWTDGVDPYRVVKSALNAGARVAVDDAMPALHLLPVAEALTTLPVSATTVLRQLRMSKDATEIDALRRAGAAIDRVHARVGEWLRPGRTEAEVAADIAAAIVEEGHTEASFVIVGSGPNGADPHHEVSERRIEAGDVVVVDIGGPVEPGYYSDSTRTYAVGEPDAEIAARFAELERAQAAAVAAVRPGVTAEAVDAAARNMLREAGLGEYFIHRTGHGIGLSVHEEPYIVEGNDIVLEPGMAFSIEPGIYFRGEWGARIEDIVVVTEDGCESMNRRPHGLTVV
ncbi:Xaa-Pro peptidase family protein [Nocardia sp. CDC159]|uniref:Xaa-Pro peptidase family protein n=1 Tax=Nocardia pulmonis TaxID=2951408 RepID=A0A9X2IXJ8_9NOCA|nr:MULTISPECIES: Xaa-Pro peptidase family protein [Nocardia]MCM6775463.1 Xaa-Pro peptidase family protein [Nocardia pulmonis]MCM6787803.1 Xaa-Pro peptidase family protein [Nocardia sp. CDC159]